MFEWSASRMLTATRARPAATLLPDPGRDGLIAALATERVRALVDQASPPPGDDGRSRLAGPLGGELAARGADLLAAVAPDRRGHAGLGEDRREPLDDRVGGRLPGRVRDRVHRDQVDV